MVVTCLEWNYYATELRSSSNLAIANVKVKTFLLLHNTILCSILYLPFLIFQKCTCNNLIKKFKNFSLTLFAFILFFDMYCANNIALLLFHSILSLDK